MRMRLLMIFSKEKSQLTPPAIVAANSLLRIPVSSEYKVQAQWLRVYRQSNELQSEVYFRTLSARIHRKCDSQWCWTYEGKVVQRMNIHICEYQSSLLDDQCVLICEVTHIHSNAKAYKVLGSQQGTVESTTTLEYVFAMEQTDTTQFEKDRTVKVVQIKWQGNWRYCFLSRFGPHFYLYKHEKTFENEVPRYHYQLKLKLLNEMMVSKATKIVRWESVFEKDVMGRLELDMESKADSVNAPLEILFQDQDLQWFLFQVSKYKRQFILKENLKNNARDTQASKSIYSSLINQRTKNSLERYKSYDQPIKPDEEYINQFERLFPICEGQLEDYQLVLTNSFESEDSQKRQESEAITRKIEEKKAYQRTKMLEVDLLKRELQQLISQEKKLIFTNLAYDVEIMKLKNAISQSPDSQLRIQLTKMLRLETKLKNESEFIEDIPINTAITSPPHNISEMRRVSKQQSANRFVHIKKFSSTPNSKGLNHQSSHETLIMHRNSPVLK